MTVTPDEGELLFVVDTKQLYVGDGHTVGGIRLLAPVFDSLEWNFITQEGVSAYRPTSYEESLRSTESGVYVVFLGGTRLQPADYSVDPPTNTFRLTSPASEGGLDLTVQYVPSSPTSKTFEWSGTTVAGQTTYAVSGNTQLTKNGRYIVFLGATRLRPSDYSIDAANNQVVLSTPPSESDLSIGVYCIGT